MDKQDVISYALERCLKLLEEKKIEGVDHLKYTFFATIRLYGLTMYRNSIRYKTVDHEDDYHMYPDTELQEAQQYSESIAAILSHLPADLQARVRQYLLGGVLPREYSEGLGQCPKHASMTFMRDIAKIKQLLPVSLVKEIKNNL